MILSIQNPGMDLLTETYTYDEDCVFLQGFNMNKSRTILLYFHTLNLIVFLLVIIYLLSITGVQSEHCCQSAPYFEENEEIKEKLEGIHVKEESCENGICLKNKRYILYDMNQGEGFNLRRDLFVRIAPLIKSLNLNSKLEWTLVLPPWRNIPHWRNTPPEKSYPWSTFFQMNDIRSYIPVMELDTYLDEHGLENPLDILYKLEHFPIVKEETRGSEEEIKFCEASHSYKFDSESETFKTKFWGHPFKIKTVQCLSLRGQASTLLPLIQEISQKSKSIMFQNAEVILWDNYGGEEWWMARASLKFSENLIIISQNFLKDNQINAYISIHLRRRDFLQGRSDFLPSIQQVAEQINKSARILRISTVFLASDAEADELSQLKSIISPQIRLILSPCITQDKLDLTEGECAVLDQILCSLGTHFLGTKDSTFTFRIFEERLLQGKSEDSTYNYLCNYNSNTSCAKPTRWIVPQSVLNYK